MRDEAAASVAVFENTVSTAQNVNSTAVIKELFNFFIIFTCFSYSLIKIYAPFTHENELYYNLYRRLGGRTEIIMGLKEQKERLVSHLTEAVGMAPLIEIHGTGELLLSGCLGITDYDRERIIVDTVRGKISICGKSLGMSVFRGDMLSREGKIHMICFGGEAVDS